MARPCDECGTKIGFFARSFKHDGDTFCSGSCQSEAVERAERAARERREEARRAAAAAREAEEARAFDRRYQSLVDEPDEMRAMAGPAALIHGNGHLLD